MLSSVFKDYLITSATTSLLIVSLLLLTPLLRKRYTAKWTYWIWVILTIRLLLPFNFPFSSNLIEIQLPERQTINSGFQEGTLKETQVKPTIADQPIQAVVESAIESPSLFSIIAIVWLIGVMLFLLYHVVGYYTFRQQVLRWSRPIENKRTAALIKNVFVQLGVPPSVTVLTSEKVPNPMIVGFRKPLLFLPHEKYSRDVLYFIIKHELVHYKRHDMMFKLLLLTVHALHWFNPFVWLLVREASRVIEIYCDETVVSKQSLYYRKKYCEAILSAMQSPNPKFLALSTNFIGGKNAMKQRFMSILSMKKKRNGVGLFCTFVLLIGTLGVLAACTNISNGKEAIKPGTIYSSIDGDPIVAYDAGNSYSINADGTVSVSYRNGAVTVKTPLKLDKTRETWDRGISASGFFISEDKTAIVYNPQPDKLSPVHVLISDDMGKTWNDYIIQGAKGNELFIGFTSKNEGWMVSGHSRGVGSALNYVFQTSDGGKTWEEVGNPNDIYSEHLTGVGFSNRDIGFLGYRYFMDDGPVIYWTKDQGKSWGKLSVPLPEKFSQYKKDPLSPIFNGKEGIFPIALIDPETGVIGTIDLYSKDGGLTWVYDEKYDKLFNKAFGIAY
ncbi:M56 family metallopeptidase [Thermicanus aegyptius]|uniref:M56 family metallopeptidase n=1 Tax=Thermicanus aegyptius TaxID=94009 RepID=UPI0004020160|nr:M56 family metallopeptidase [Thermicanus aegyptius]